MYRQENRVVTRATAEAAFSFSATVDNWSQFHPMTVRCESERSTPMQKGSTITEYTNLPAPADTLIWEVAESDPPRMWKIVGDNGSVVYSFRAIDQGTEVTRTMELPVTVATDRQEALHAVCQQALENLKDILEAQS